MYDAGNMGSARMGSARMTAIASGDEFQRMENLLATDLLGKLKQEHEREIQLLWEEQIMLRGELTRIVELMQTEILPRELQMHGLLEGMQEAYQAATSKLHSELTKHVEDGTGKAIRQKRQEMENPMKDMECELARIAELLGHEISTPEIASWRSSSVAQASSLQAGVGVGSTRQTSVGQQQQQQQQRLGGSLQVQASAPRKFTAHFGGSVGAPAFAAGAERAAGAIATAVGSTTYGGLGLGAGGASQLGVYGGCGGSTSGFGGGSTSATNITLGTAGGSFSRTTVGGTVEALTSPRAPGTLVGGGAYGGLSSLGTGGASVSSTLARSGGGCGCSGTGGGGGGVVSPRYGSLGGGSGGYGGVQSATGSGGARAYGGGSTTPPASAGGIGSGGGLGLGAVGPSQLAAYGGYGGGGCGGSTTPPAAGGASQLGGYGGYAGGGCGGSATPPGGCGASAGMSYLSQSMAKSASASYSTTMASATRTTTSYSAVKSSNYGEISIGSGGSGGPSPYTPGLQSTFAGSDIYSSGGTPSPRSGDGGFGGGGLGGGLGGGMGALAGAGLNRSWGGGGAADAKPRVRQF